MEKNITEERMETKDNIKNENGKEEDNNGEYEKSSSWCLGSGIYQHFSK
jgi:hypothetical protein